jgi:hypothetical protein
MTKGREALPARVGAEQDPFFIPTGQVITLATNGEFCSATTLAGSTSLPFVISTGAQRSGEISVWIRFLGNVFLAKRSPRDLRRFHVRIDG